MLPLLYESGRSTEDRAISATLFWAADRPASEVRWFWILGGVHGDETEGVWLAEWSEQFLGTYTTPTHWAGHGVVVVPRMNPDGVANGTRQNARGVDLNRNLPTKDWTPTATKERYAPGPTPASEPETQAFLKLWETHPPMSILSLHSFSEVQINVNGPARDWAERLHAVCHYPITDDIGYPTPGCLGSFAGHERGIPTITLEIERGLERKRVLELHRGCIEASVDRFFATPTGQVSQ